MARRKDNGDGSVYQISENKWGAAIQLGRKSNGKPNIKQFSARTEAEVKRKLKEFKKKRGLIEESKNSGKLSLEEYMKNWLYSYQQSKLKEQSFDRLESTVLNHIIPEFGWRPFDSVTPDDIQDFILSKSKLLSYSSIKKIYLAFNACYNHALKEPPSSRKTNYNPCVNVILPKTNLINKKSKAPRFFSEQEIVKIRKIINSRYTKYSKARIYPYGDIYLLILNTGIRGGEAVSICKSDVDLVNRRIFINKNQITSKKRDNSGFKTSGYNTKIQNSAKTYSSTRWVPLNENAYAAVVNLLKYSIDKNNDFLVCNTKGNILKTQTLEKTFSSILKAVNIQDASVHTLRHTFASLMFKKGIEVKIVSEILGHSSVKITYDTYIHLIEEQQKLAVQNLIPNI